jgi:hypothetical protein
VAEKHVRAEGFECPGVGIEQPFGCAFVQYQLGGKEWPVGASVD